MEYLFFLENALRALPAIGVVLLSVVVLWWIIDLLTPFDDTEELFVRDNVAYLCQRLGLSAGQVVAMLAVIPQFDVDRLGPSLLVLGIQSAWVIVALVLARWCVDRMIVSHERSQRLLAEGNLAVGIAEGGAYVGIGLLLGGSLTGTADTLWLLIASTAVFYLLGLACLLGAYWLYEAVTPYRLRTLLVEGTPASGIELAGVFIAVCTVVKVGVAGDFSRWGEAFAWFFVTVAVALVVQALVYVITILLARLIWKVPNGELRTGLSTSVAGFRAGAMVLTGIVTAGVLNVT